VKLCVITGSGLSTSRPTYIFTIMTHVFGSQHFRHAVLTVWNSLAVHSTNDFNVALLSAFESNLKTHFTQSRNCPCAPAIYFWRATA